MKHFTILLLCLIAISMHSLSQGIAISNDNSDPDASAMLDVKSTEKGVLIPRMTSTQRTSIAGPANGLLVFDSDTESFWFFTAGEWTELIDRNHTTWKQNGADAYYENGKVGIGTPSPDEQLDVNASADSKALGVSVDNISKLMVHENGGTSVGSDELPPADGLLVKGNLRTYNKIISDEHLQIQCDGPGKLLQLIKGSNAWWLDGSGIYGYSTGNFIVESLLSSSKILMNANTFTMSSGNDILVESTGSGKSVTIKVGAKEIIVDDNNGITINTGGSDVNINSGGGNISMNSGNGNISLDAGTGNFDVAAGSFSVDALNSANMVSGGTAGISSSLGMTFQNTTGTLQLNSQAITGTSGTTLSLSAPLIKLNANGSGFPVARLGSQVIVNTATGIGSITSGTSSSVLIGN
ncbi:MAG: hypothetical protein KDC05_00880 [Bacteroidales bacterium]|nr:hypothetical protein [Bacteroidales bacterium]